MVVHLLEPGGLGGVYQHTVAIAELLAHNGHEVVLHTAADAELAPSGALLCGCVEWHRGMLPGRARSAAIGGDYLRRTVPHLAAAVSRGDVLHAQGRFKPGLLLLPMLAARARGARVVASPHNFFARGGGRLDGPSLRATIAVSHAVVVFSAPDGELCKALGTEGILSPLLMHVEPVEPERVEAWRRRWGASDGLHTLLFAGQLRPDKRLDLAIEAAAELPADRWRLAVVGEDKGCEAEMRTLADRRGVAASWSVEYVAAPDFAAAIAAADVVCCPYDRASQSAVLAVAGQLGVPTVARDVGGLGEIATEVVDTTAPAAIARACERALASPVTPSAWPSRTLAAHRRAYARDT